MSNTPLIELRNVYHSFALESGRQVRALENITLSVQDQEVLVLLGPSGSGKSTCLRILAGLIPPTQGEVLLNGQRMEGVNASLALVFQNFALLPWLSVEENIALGLNTKNITPDDAHQRIRHTIDLVGLGGFEEAYPRELSGGMKQRVGIARALVMNRPVLALDEPFSALDVLTAESLRKEVLQVWRSKRTDTRALILVTHNISEAVSMGTRIVVMGSNPGHIRFSIENKIPYPRVENADAFRILVEDLHAILTEAILPDIPDKVSPEEKKPLLEAIPPVSLIEVTGLLEAVSLEGGEVSALTLAQEMRRDAVHILLMAHAAEMIDLIDTPKNIIVLTELGRQFIQGDVSQRKKLLHAQMLRLPLAQRFHEHLAAMPDKGMHKSEAERLMHDWLPNESPETVLHTLIQWGRFAELFGYSDKTKSVYIDQG